LEASETNRRTLIAVQKLLIKHLLDPMHCEKNLIENVVKTFFGTKDSLGSKQDMETLGIRENLWLEPLRNNRDAFHVPDALYVLKPAERKMVIDIIRSLKTPSNYCGNIVKCLADGKLHYMKSHDFHVLLQQVSGFFFVF
jgi:hypothetical protein